MRRGEVTERLPVFAPVVVVLPRCEPPRQPRTPASTAVTQPIAFTLCDALAVWDRFMADGGAP